MSTKKCYNCAFGHISADCRAPKKERKKHRGTEVACIAAIGENKLNVPVKINDAEIGAQLETASPYTIICHSTYNFVPRLGKWTKHQLPMKGLSVKPHNTLGYKWVTVKVNNEDYKLQMSTTSCCQWT